MKQPFFILGKVKIYFYGIFITIGMIIGYVLANKRISKFNISKGFFERLIVVLIPSTIIGARIYHVLSWSSYYRIFPKEILNFWMGGYGNFGAIILGILVIFIFSRLEKTSFFLIGDFLSPVILLIQAMGRIGNFFNLEAFGPPTNLPWKVYIPPDKRPIIFLNYSYFHPTFFYESLLCFLSLGFLFYLEKKFDLKEGFSSGFYFVSYGLIRFFTEFFRIDTWQIMGIKVAQILSLFFILMGFVLIKGRIVRKKLLK